MGKNHLFNALICLRYPVGLFMLSLVFYACANIVAPTGGPRDEDPPVVVRSVPPNHSPNFDTDQIRIFFDEYVELRNIRQQLLVSPPLSDFPDVRIRRRSIVIDIEENLRENTTYNFFFGDAIRDITEGNAIPNFQFVFSTGEYVDSLSVRGKVINAFTHEPEEGIFVMMYDSIVDSIPYLERPVYLAKTDKEGLFTIGNMRGGEFLMFALKDNNANFLYDLPDEKIAFLDSLVTPDYVAPLRTDTIEEGPDDLRELEFAEGQTGEERQEPAFYTLYLFQEPDTVQRITSSSVVRKGMVQLTFRVPFDSAYVREIRPEKDTDWHIPEFSAKRDTLNLWITDPERDSLFIEVFDREHLLDTLRRPARPRPARGRGAEEAEEYPPLEIVMDGQTGRTWPYFKPFALKASSPLQEIDHEKISIFISDTLPVERTFKTVDRVLRRMEADSLPVPQSPYRIKALPGAFTDIFGVTNDTLVMSFRTTAPEDYGKLIMDMSLPRADGHFILQLLGRQGNVLQEKFISKDGTYTFGNLPAGQYHLRLIDDLNNNGEWDTGIYLKKRLPEPVYIFQEEIQIRQNWEIELPWVVENYQ